MPSDAIKRTPKSMTPNHGVMVNRVDQNRSYEPDNQKDRSINLNGLLTKADSLMRLLDLQTSFTFAPVY